MRSYSTFYLLLTDHFFWLRLHHHRFKCPFRVRVPRRNKLLETTLEKWRRCTMPHSSPERKLEKKEEVSDLLSVSLVFYELKVVVEAGSWSVESFAESRALISGFTHSFYRLLPQLSITFRHLYLCDPIGCYLAYKILVASRDFF